MCLTMLSKTPSLVTAHPNTAPSQRVFSGPPPEAKEQPATRVLKYLICKWWYPGKVSPAKKKQQVRQPIPVVPSIGPSWWGWWFYMILYAIRTNMFKFINPNWSTGWTTVQYFSKCSFKFKQFVLNIKSAWSWVLSTHYLYPPLPLRKVSLFSIAWARLALGPCQSYAALAGASSPRPAGTGRHLLRKLANYPSSSTEHVHKKWKPWWSCGSACAKISWPVKESGPCSVDDASKAPWVANGKCHWQGWWFCET